MRASGFGLAEYVKNTGDATLSYSVREPHAPLVGVGLKIYYSDLQLYYGDVPAMLACVIYSRTHLCASAGVCVGCGDKFHNQSPT